MFFHTCLITSYDKTYVRTARFTLCYQTVVCLSVCNVAVLWPNGWMDPDETWHAGRPWLSSHCVRWGPSSSSPKGAQPPIFGRYLLWPNGCMDQYATCREVGVGPGHTVRWGPALSPPKKGHSRPIFGPCLL